MSNTRMGCFAWGQSFHDFWARGLLNLTISIHREEQTITMLFTGSFILALMCSDFGFVHETTIFYWWWILWDFSPQIFVCLFTLGKRNW